MKKYITYLLATALVGSAFVSCSERLQEGEMRISTHKVHFSASDAETRTGLSIDGTTVTPDWNKTAVESIHLFEIDANDAVAYGETIAITTSEDKATAHFEADFPTDMSIIVDPSDPEEDSGAKGAKGTKGTRVSPYRYAAIIAQKPDKNNFTFVVPGEQHPDAETLKDPDADFLIGYSRKAYDTEHFFDEPVVDLYFDRVAALGRLAISNFAEDDGMVKSVTINAQNGLTGSASYADIDFENGSVSFVREEGPGAITLVYDGGMDIPADGPFYAYFVAIPGSATLTSVEVVTDQYRYTKTIEGGKELTFSEKAFKSMNLDLSTATREEVAPSGLTWYKASMFEDGIDYLIVSAGQALKNNDGATAGVSVTDNEGVITLEAADPTIVWTAAAISGLEDYGHFTLSNGEGNYLQRKSNQQDQSIIVDGVPSGDKKYYVWNYDGTHLSHVSSPTDNRIFYCYYSGGWSTSYQEADAKPVAIYTSRAPQELAFTPAASAEYDLATSEWIVAVPTLSGAQTSVTYALSEDSNPAVATVDADGTVHPLSKGAVTIVATAAGNDQYQAASASYTLVITNSSITIPTWYKAEEIVAGETYLVVSHDYALDNNGTSAGAAVHLENVGETIEYDAPETLIWTATNESSGKFRLTGSDGKVIRLSSSSSFQIGTASGTESNNQWSLDADGLVKSGNYFLYYSTSQSKWAVSNSASDSHTGYLYASSPALPPRNLAFSATSVTHDLATQGTDVQEPTLSGVTEGVEYSSSNTSIATVNATTGEVSLTGKTGSAVITASAQKTDSYKAEEVSYDLIVKDSSAPSKTYKKITSTSQLTVGAKYLLVYESTPSVFKPILDGSTFKKHKDNVQSVTISNNSITSAEMADFELTLMEGYYLFVGSADRYLYPYTENNNTSIQAETSASHALNITFQSDGTAKITNATTTAASFCWSTNSDYFSSTYSTSVTINVCLYKEDDGSNPGGGDDPTPTGTTYYPASSIVAGQQYLIVSNGKALQNDGGSAAALDVTVASGTITMDAPASILWTAQEDGGAFDFINNSQYLRRPSSGTTVGVGNKSSTADNNQWYYDADNQQLTVKHTSSQSGNTTTYYLRYNTSWEISTTAGNVVLYTADPGSDNP